MSITLVDILSVSSKMPVLCSLYD